MRTTVTLEPDTRLLVERLMADRGLSFKEAVNTAIRLGLAGSPDRRTPYTQPRQLGPAHVDLTHAIEVAGRLEDEVLARRLSEGR